MSVLLFLLIPIVVVVIGSSVLVLRQRKPTSQKSSVDAFQREMRALSPDSDPRHRS
jgi:hypothetical protein